MIHGALLSVSLLLLVIGCSQADAPVCPDGMDRFVEYQLFMGRNGPDGEIVDDEDWETFLADWVTPRFPDGLTVLDGKGQWRGSDGQVKRERSKLLVILAQPGESNDRLIDEISEEYRSQFNQESVLKVVEDTCVSFS